MSTIARLSRCQICFTIIAIEQGKYSPSLEAAFRIARALDAPLDEVFGLDA
jgi:DNA-binding XRE family transcriptional regulator